jgi:hypothetical protein
MVNFIDSDEDISETNPTYDENDWSSSDPEDGEIDEDEEEHDSIEPLKEDCVPPLALIALSAYIKTFPVQERGNLGKFLSTIGSKESTKELYDKCFNQQEGITYCRICESWCIQRYHHQNIYLFRVHKCVTCHTVIEETLEHMKGNEEETWSRIDKVKWVNGEFQIKCYENGKFSKYKFTSKINAYPVLVDYLNRYIRDDIKRKLLYFNMYCIDEWVKLYYYVKPSVKLEKLEMYQHYKKVRDDLADTVQRDGDIDHTYGGDCLCDKCMSNLISSGFIKRIIDRRDENFSECIEHPYLCQGGCKRLFKHCCAYTCIPDCARVEIEYGNDMEMWISLKDLLPTRKYITRITPSDVDPGLVVVDNEDPSINIGDCFCIDCIARFITEGKIVYEDTFTHTSTVNILCKTSNGILVSTNVK